MLHTRQTKEEFIQRLNDEIKLNTMLLDFYTNVFVPTLQKFDGKVYNKRFTNALRDQRTSELMLIRERENDQIVVELYHSKFNYQDCQRMYCKVLTKYDNGNERIIAEDSLKDQYGVQWIKNIEIEIENLHQAIENYDKYLAVANECQDAICKFAELPYQFRNNCYMEKTYYLPK